MLDMAPHQDGLIDNEHRCVPSLSVLCKGILEDEVRQVYVKAKISMNAEELLNSLCKGAGLAVVSSCAGTSLLLSTSLQDGMHHKTS